MSQTNQNYNDQLSADRQLKMEEDIAATIFERCDGVNEEECAQLGRDLLLLVLAEFRPDLFEKPTEHPREPSTIDRMMDGKDW